MASKHSRDHETSDEDVPTEQKTPKKGKRTFRQVFFPQYCQKFPFITPSKEGKDKAYCKVCKVDITIERSGAFDIKRHAAGKFHQQKGAAAGSALILTHFNKLSNEEGGLKEKTMRAEAVFCHLVSGLNLPLATMSKLTEIVKVVAMSKLTEIVKVAFPDSKIAAG